MSRTIVEGRAFTVILDDDELAVLCRAALDNDVSPADCIKADIARMVKAWAERPEKG